MIKIHNFAHGARGQRLMWQCEEMGLPYTVQNHSFPVDSDYRALNPMGTVPFLEDAEGVAINESVAMMLYIAHKYGPTPLLPLTNSIAMGRTYQLTLFGETELGMNLNVLLTAHFMAPQIDKRNWSVLGLEQRIDRAVNYAATLLGGKSYLVGDDLTLAAELEAYRTRLQQRPAYVRAKTRCATQSD
jgi:glutathione S-transferase